MVATPETPLAGEKLASRGATTAYLISTPETGVDSIFVTWSLLGAVFAVVDKLTRQPRDVSRGKLHETGLRDDAIDILFEALGSTTLDDIERRFSDSAEVQLIVSQMRRYFECLEALDVLEWVTIDLTIVRGLAYYTGIVFELFDATGELVRGLAEALTGRYDVIVLDLMKNPKIRQNDKVRAHNASLRSKKLQIRANKSF